MQLKGDNREKLLQGVAIVINRGLVPKVAEKELLSVVEKCLTALEQSLVSHQREWPVVEWVSRQLTTAS